MAATSVVLALFIIVVLSFSGSPAEDIAGRETGSYAGFSQIDQGKTFFIIVGDTRRTSNWEFWRERNGKERRQIIDEITRREPAFVVNLGDLITQGGSEEDWRDFDDLNRALREEGIPYFPILGNHELYGDRETALRNYFARFPALEDRRWYGFTWKGLGFIMLDSNFSSLTEEERKRQQRWYISELRRFDRDERVHFVIVCCHEPPFTNGEVEAPSKESETFFAVPFLRHRKTCLFFSGHSHTYERFGKGRKFFIVSGGGGAPRHRVALDPATRRYRDLFPGPALRSFHFCEIEVRGRTLLFRMVRLGPDGSFSAVDPVTINPSSPFETAGTSPRV
ncbi:MAG: metallophosphoesterase [Nitrospirae bacterium]|nr:metallophosphoesterase [Nitrospirota bacterium]